GERGRWQVRLPGIGAELHELSEEAQALLCARACVLYDLHVGEELRDLSSHEGDDRVGEVVRRTAQLSGDRLDDLAPDARRPGPRRGQPLELHAAGNVLPL